MIQPGFHRSPAPWRLMMSLTPSRGCLLDLPWEDILVPHILCHLPLQQLLSLQRVSKSFQSLIQLYLANMRCFDSSQVSDGSEAGGGTDVLAALELTGEHLTMWGEEAPGKEAGFCSGAGVNGSGVRLDRWAQGGEVVIQGPAMPLTSARGLGRSELESST